MKKGIALLITMGFIAVLSAVIAFVFSLSSRAFDDADKIQKRDQSTILFNDVKKLLDSYAKEVKDDDDLSVFFMGTPPFYDKKSGLELELDITPLSNRININSILLKNKIDTNIEKYIQNICELYNILNPTFLISLILDTIDKDDIPRDALSEISLQNTKYSNGLIFDKKQFETLKNYYAKITHDNNIFKAPWDKFIYFGEKNQNMLDCNRVGKEAVWVMGLDSENYQGCDSLDTNESKEIAAKYRLKKFNKEDNYYILVKIYYQIDKIKDRASFIYDMKTHKASSFELF